MDYSSEVSEAIPHRPPFLWVDKVLSYDSKKIITEKFISPELDVFKGHYPEYPLMPGVLLCEAVFQTAALFMAKKLLNSEKQAKTDKKTPMLTRIKEAKFKREVKPGDTIRIHVTMNENIGNAWFFKGKVLVKDKTAVKVNFACALSENKISETVSQSQGC